ncbi:thiamine pyrophosphokinase [Agrobacterium tumefaciens]|uniref:Thiamine diphosphokinase n=1 Tax=Agrobacterium tumefaciens TaxID=358 RepID=A0A0D0KAI4_AGRTU|nr:MULTISPECIES: thiamine diphosphokinase [Rhizobium]KIQ05832.1 thiamine pyrophosphokinase [Agrobacterium tumefaciens]MCI9867912.1 thiamine diphosphokinase [Rhizobium skierniewicense]
MSSAPFTILLGGNITVTDRLQKAVAGTRAIAADSGMRHAAPLGLTPELWVGDFDSSDADLMSQWQNVPQQPFPAAKGVTDGEIAVSEALSRGANRLVLVGALAGERSDHALFHLLYAVSLAERGFDVILTSGTEEAYPLLAGDLSIDLPAGSLFSIAGFTALEGLDIDNARYPLEDFALAFGSSRTISNVAEGALRLRLESGKAIVLARPYDLTGA